MVENEEFVPEGANILEAEIEDMTAECIQAQNQISFGVFCLMASEEASRYIKMNSTRRLTRHYEVTAEA